MSTTVATAADWIKRIADDERQRDQARLRENEATARKADLVHRRGRRLLDELRAAITRDVEAFRVEFAGDITRDVVVGDVERGGFVVRKPAPGATALIVNPNLDTATVACVYRFTMANGLPPREDRIDILVFGDKADVLQFKHNGTGQVFVTTDALSEFLLTPVLTGRSRS